MASSQIRFSASMAAQAIGQDGLAVADLVALGQAAQEHAAADVGQELVAPRHGLEEGLEPEVGDQVGFVGRQGRRGIEVGATVEQMDLHATTRRFTSLYVSSYFSAIARA